MAGLFALVGLALIIVVVISGGVAVSQWKDDPRQAWKARVILLVFAGSPCFFLSSFFGNLNSSGVGASTSSSGGPDLSAVADQLAAVIPYVFPAIGIMLYVAAAATVIHHYKTRGSLEKTS